MADTDGLIILPKFRFKDHVLVSEWLNATEYGEKYYLVMAEATLHSQSAGIRGYEQVIICSGLEPISEEQRFLFRLKGSEGLAKLAEEMERKILDFHHK